MNYASNKRVKEIDNASNKRVKEIECNSNNRVEIPDEYVALGVKQAVWMDTTLYFNVEHENLMHEDVIVKFCEERAREKGLTMSNNGNMPEGCTLKLEKTPDMLKPKWMDTVYNQVLEYKNKIFLLPGCFISITRMKENLLSVMSSIVPDTCHIELPGSPNWFDDAEVFAETHKQTMDDDFVIIFYKSIRDRKNKLVRCFSDGRREEVR